MCEFQGAWRCLFLGKPPTTAVPLGDDINFDEGDLSPEETRAVILGKLVSATHIPTEQDRAGRDISRSFISTCGLAEIFSTLLNRGENFCLPKGNDELVTKALLNCVVEKKTFLNGTQVPLADVFQDVDSWNLPTIEKILMNELNILCSGLSASAGVASYHVAATPTLLDFADCVAGLSCEAFGAKKAPLDSFEYGKQTRNNKGMERSASNLENILQNSDCVVKPSKKAKKSKSSGDEAYTTIPQFHGPAREIVDVTRRTIQGEFNARPSQVKSEPHGLMVCLYNLSRALSLISMNCRDRILCFLTKLLKNELDGCGKVATGLLQNVVDQLKVFPETPMEHAILLGNIVKYTNALLRLELSLSVSYLDNNQKSRREKALTRHNKKKAGRQKQAEKMGWSPEKVQQEEEKALHTLEVKSKLPLGVGSRKLFDEFLKVLPPLDIQSESLSTTLTQRCSVSDVYSISLGQWLEEVLASTQTVGDVRLPKGTRDTTPEQMVIREKAFTIITDVFKRHGAQAIDTPVFELKEILMGRYGEDSKLIYDLADQGGDALSLRYDLTVPFARFVAMNPAPIKRYHIARVYRRDNPVVTKGRFREFYQCDYDIAGHYETMMPDADVLAVVCEILDSLNLGGFIIKVNHRKLLNAVITVSGVPQTKFKTVCSSVDKLDKMSPEDVGDELVNQKGLSRETADKILKLVANSGNPHELLKHLKTNDEFKELANDSDGKIALSDLSLLFDYLESMDCTKFLSFDLSLARGLDYYTGPIFEAVLTKHGGGSIAGGGRYDDLIGTFQGSREGVPAVGVSVGIERIMAILETAQKQQEQEQKENEEKKIARKNYTEVVVGSYGKNMSQHRMQLCRELWNAGINAEFMYKKNPDPKEQLEFALDMGCPYLIYLDEDRIQNNTVQLKNTSEKTEQLVPRDELIPYLKSLLRKGPVF